MQLFSVYFPSNNTTKLSKTIFKKSHRTNENTSIYVYLNRHALCGPFGSSAADFPPQLPPSAPRSPLARTGTVYRQTAAVRLVYGRQSTL